MDIKCTCGKKIARVDNNNNIYVWCKQCKKEVKIETGTSDTAKKTK